MNHARGTARILMVLVWTLAISPLIASADMPWQDTCEAQTTFGSLEHAVCALVVPGCHDPCEPVQIEIAVVADSPPEGQATLWVVGEVAETRTCTGGAQCKGELIFAASPETRDVPCRGYMLGREGVHLAATQATTALWIQCHLLSW